MNLFDYAKPFVLLERRVVSDGMGGWNTTWADGAEFLCLLAFHNSVEALAAAQVGVTSLFTGTVEKEFPLQHGDIIKSKETGDTYRVTSNPDDDVVPEISTMQTKEFSAEKFTLPR